jgi:dipeptidyl aminopeptidase/acylaminoacyl peptidase
MASHRSGQFLFVALLVSSWLCAQEPPPSIVVEGVPPVPAELRARMNQYLNMRSALFADWQAPGRVMLVVTRFGDTNQLHLVSTPGAYRRQLTFFPDRVLGARSSPRAEGNYFVFGMDTGGAEFYQIYRFGLADGKITLLTDGQSRNTGWLFNHRGTLAAYMSTRRNGRDADLYLLDPENPAGERRTLEVKGTWAPLDWSPDDARLLLVEYISVNESYLHLFDVASGRAELLTPKGAEKVAYGGSVWAKDGKGLYLISDRGSEFQRLFHYDLAAKSFTSLTEHIPWDVEDLDISPDGRVLALTANEEGISKLHLLDTSTRRELSPPQLPQGQVYNLKFHPTLDLLAFNIGSAKSPGDVYSYDLNAQRLERWTFSETGGLDAEKFSEAQLIRYPTFDHVNGKPRRLAAFVTRPPARFKPPYPVLIDIHGGPEGQARPGFQGRYNYLIDELGIALIEPNVRGSTGYGKSFTRLDNGFLREDSVKDIGALLDWVARQPDLDAKRVAVMGGSYGGYMSLASMTHFSDRLRCGVDIVGISNFVTFLESTQEYRRDLRRVEYGDERDAKMREFLQSISPLNNTGKIRVPMLVAAGQNDPRVPVGESQQIAKQVRARGGTVWYVLAKDEGHGFAKKQNADYVWQAVTMFLEKYLLD